MRKQTLFLILFFVTSAWSAWAFLPPDASAREPEIRAHRIRVRRAYEKRMVQRHAFAVEQYKKTEALIRIPPWDREQAVKAEVPAGRTDGSKTLAEKGATKGKNRFWVSIVLLILIGSAVGWVKHKTQNADR